MELLLTDSPLYGKLSEEGGLILPRVKPAGVLQKLSEALDGREKIPALVSALGNECSPVSLLWLNGRGRREWEQSHDVSWQSPGGISGSWSMQV